jgi:hypothetical protein
MNVRGLMYQPREMFANDYLPSTILIGILNGLIGYRERSSHHGVILASALLAVVNVAVHSVYEALWGPSLFTALWQHEPYFFITFANFVLILILSDLIWSGCRKRANLPGSPRNAIKAREMESIAVYQCDRLVPQRMTRSK